MVISPNNLILGSLNIVPEDRKRPSSKSHFFDVNNNLIGAGLEISAGQLEANF